MDNKTILKIQKFVESKQNEADAKRAEWETKLNSAQAQKEQANGLLTETFTAGDVKAYHAAQDQSRTASDAIAMYTAKLEKLAEDPVITKAEFEQYASEIRATLDEANHAAAVKIGEIINEQIEPIGREIYDLIETGNALIEQLQLDLLKDKRAAEIPAFIEKYVGHSIAAFIHMLKESRTYKEGSENE